MFPNLRLLMAAGLFLRAVAHGAEPVDRFDAVTWRTDVGGPRKSVERFAQSPDGFLWMLNGETLSRFDGSAFVSMDLGEMPAGRGPVGLWSDAGGMWMATADGAVWEWKTGKFFRLFQPGEGTAFPVRVWSLNNRKTRILTQDGKCRDCPANGQPVEMSGPAIRVGAGGTALSGTEAWWVTPSGGVARRTETETVEVPVPGGAGAVRTLAAESPGILWAGADHALLRWNGQAFEAVPPPGQSGEWQVTQLLSGSRGPVWMEANGALWVQRGDRWREVPCAWPPRGGLRASSVDGNGNFWYATGEARLAALKPDGRDVTLTGLAPLDGTLVDALFNDREGNIWAGITRVGLVQFRPQRFQSLTTADGLPAPMVWTVCEDGAGAVWFAGEAHFLGRWQGGGLTVFSKDKGTLPELAGALWRDPDGSLLTGMARVGTLQERGGGFHLILPPMGSNYHFIFDDSAGRRWVGTNAGLYMVKDGVIQRFGLAEGLPGPALRSGGEDKAGRIWVGTAGGGAAWLGDGRFHAVTTGNGLPHNVVYALAPAADGSMWIGTVGGGLANWREGRITRYTQDDGLPDNRIMSVLEDGLGWLWVATRAGLARISLKSLRERETSGTAPLELIVFDRSDGLPTREFSGGKQPAVWRGGDGWLWFATTGGVASCQPAHLPLNTIPPQVQMLDVRLDSRPVDQPVANEHSFESLKCAIPAALEIPPGPHSLELRWTAPCLISGEKMRYSTRLSGLERNWSPPGPLASATYGTLAPGHYEFLVRACNHDGTWSLSPASVSITVHPYWWQRTDVRVAGGFLAAGALSLAVWLIARARHRRHLAREELRRVRETERSRIARDLHDDLGASLTEISMLATSVPAAAQGPDALRGRLSAISGRARSLVEALDEIVWAVNPRHDTADSLAIYLTGYTRDFLTASDIECTFDVPSPLPHIPLDAEPRHSLFLSLKEVLNNIVRHSGATRVRFSLRAGGDSLEITVEDNGRGLKAPADNGGDGLTNLRQRLDSLGGVCEVTSQEGAGTTVRMRLPVPLPDTSLPS
ncbi:MAG TPA: two-component regulator propeller domain-containing protein [Verrucomicrobiales bacterium]|nr:two-component regulator propeller domain-containing protein [Verrucomicrobiales bacterium]